ncbi:MAG: type 1 glutamine amidotransferase [Pseudomonadota bacterium]
MASQPVKTNTIPLHVAVLETGHSPESLIPRYGSYPEMGTQLLIDALGDVKSTIISPVSGEPLPAPSDFDAYLIMGSEFSANDHFDWISELIAFIQALAIARTPLLGICFGHQVIAKAMGGKIENIAWVVGKQHYHPVATARQSGASGFDTLCFHQDQVTALPPAAERDMASRHCENAAIRYTDWPCWTIQSHPEFGLEYTCDLIEYCRANPLTDQQVDDAIASTDGYVENNALVIGNIRQVMRPAN